MNCEKWMLYQSGELNAQERQAFETHLAACPQCRANLHVAEALGIALAAPAAPVQVVENLFAKTTRKPSFFKRWRMVLAGSAASLIIGVCVGVGYFHHASVADKQLVEYISQTQPGEYTLFLNDLEMFEQEFRR